MKFTSLQNALDSGDVTKWLMSISGYGCRGETMLECLRDYDGRETLMQKIFDSHWDDDHARENAKETLLMQCVDEWFEERPHHPDLFCKQETAIIDGEVMPEFEVDDEEIDSRVVDDYQHELQWAIEEIEAMLRKDDTKGALEWIGVKMEDVSIEGFICKACGDESEYDGKRCHCGAPFCSNCFNNYCGVCGHDFDVEEKLELAHG